MILKFIFWQLIFSDGPQSLPSVPRVAMSPFIFQFSLFFAAIFGVVCATTICDLNAQDDTTVAAAFKRVQGKAGFNFLPAKYARISVADRESSR